MIAKLIEQLGMKKEALFNPDQAKYIDQQHEQNTNDNIFHVESALGNELIPAQADFVIPHKIQSVLAFGGMLPNGELFAVTLFSKVPIYKSIVQLFAPLPCVSTLLFFPLTVTPFSSPPITPLIRL